MPRDRVIQGGDGMSLALEALAPFGVIGERAGKELERDIAPQAGIPCAIDLAHTALADGGEDLVGTKPGMRAQ